MSFDTSKLFGVETQDVKREKLPTISQFIKRTREPKSKPLHKVEIAWLPGKFDNFTLQTKHYRVIVSSKHPFYGLLRDFFADKETAETPIAIRITSWSTGSYMLEEPSRTHGMWSELSTSGYRWIDD